MHCVRNDDRLGETARRAGIAVFVAVTAASAVLVYAAFHNDFSVAYILHHSNRALPAPYKFAALWSGQEGSLLFWCWLLAAYGLVLRLRHKVDTRLGGARLGGHQRGADLLSSLVNFAAHPFALVAGTIPADGNGLNPLLQYPEMVIHPPMLYLGYVGMTVPFCFALAALIMKYPGEKWIHITRRWTMVGWLFLTCGIFLGSYWAYRVLGWGGWWGWDPVENASLLPWLTGTAFLHSVMMQEKRGMMKVWNMWLIFSTFLLAIFGTFLTRSGVVSSVHAFAESDIGPYFVFFLALTFATCAFFFVRNRSHLGKRAQAGVAGFARIELPVQQCAAAGGGLRRALGHAVPGAQRMGDRTQSYGGAAVLQQGQHSDCALPAAADRRGAAAGLGQRLRQRAFARTSWFRR